MEKEKIEKGLAITIGIIFFFFIFSTLSTSIDYTTKTLDQITPTDNDVSGNLELRTFAEEDFGLSFSYQVGPAGFNLRRIDNNHLLFTPNNNELEGSIDILNYENTDNLELRDWLEENIATYTDREMEEILNSPHLLPWYRFSLILENDNILHTLALEEDNRVYIIKLNYQIDDEYFLRLALSLIQSINIID